MLQTDRQAGRQSAIGQPHSPASQLHTETPPTGHGHHWARRPVPQAEATTPGAASPGAISARPRTAGRLRACGGPVGRG